MWSQSLDTLAPSDIQCLIEDEVEESASLEYKEQLPGGGDEDRREFLYDVSALANAGGGYLLFGISDKRDSQNKPTGIADKIVGLVAPNVSAEIARLENMIRDGIAPRLTGVHNKVLDCGPAIVLVLAIPQSWNAPHMVTFKHANKFYSRVSSGKYLMSVDQIGRAFCMQSALRESIQSWRQRRVEVLRSGNGPIELQQGPTALIHVIPASAFSLQSIRSTWILSEDLRLKMHCPSTQFSGSGRYNGDGYLKWAEVAPSAPTTGYTQVFRNGIIEYVTAHFSWGVAPPKESPIFTQFLEQELIKGYRDARKTFQELQLVEPVYVGVDLFGLKGKSMYISHRNIYALKPMRDDAFSSPEVLLEADESAELPAALKVLADMMWQAGGLEGTPFMESGVWTPFIER
jgi:hypothetical protein